LKADNIYLELKDMYITRGHTAGDINRKEKRRKINLKQLNQTTDHLDLTNTSSASNSRASRCSTSNRLAVEVDKEGGIGSTKSTRTTEGIQLTGMTKVGSAGSISSGRRGTKELPSVGEKRGDDVLEDIALNNSLTTSSDVKSVARVGIPVIVNSVEKRVSANLRAAARCVVDVVVLHSNKVRGAS
jgi:hypothetical protein